MGGVFIILAIVLFSTGFFHSINGVTPFSMVLGIVAIVVFGGILREFAKSRRNISSSVHKDLEELKQHIVQIEADIADIKEQIADSIIKQI